MGGEDLYKFLLPQFESSSLMPYLENIAKEFNMKEWDKVKFYVHTMKTPAGCIGASRLHYACYFIQKAFHEGDIESMIEYYPFLIETAIEVRIHLRPLVAKYSGRCKCLSHINSVHLFSCLKTLIL